MLAQGKRNWKQILQKAAKHGHILETKDASEILTSSNTKRRHVMEALVCLSKYQGTYNTWKEIKEKYQLKWTSPDSLEVFQSIINNEKNYSASTNIGTWLYHLHWGFSNLLSQLNNVSSVINSLESIKRASLYGILSQL